MRLAFCFKDLQFAQSVVAVKSTLPPWHSINVLASQDIKAFKMEYNERHARWANYLFSELEKITVSTKTKQRMKPLNFGNNDVGLMFFDNLGKFRLALIVRPKHYETLVFYSGEHALQIPTMLGVLSDASKEISPDNEMTVCWKKMVGNSDTIACNEGSLESWRQDYSSVSGSNLIASFNQGRKGPLWDPISVLAALELNGNAIGPTLGCPGSLPAIIHKHFTEVLSPEQTKRYHELQRIRIELNNQIDAYFTENFNWSDVQ